MSTEQTEAMEGEYLAADINQETAMQAMDYTQERLDKLAEVYAKVPDAATKEGYKLIQGNLTTMTKFRTAVTARHAELKKPALERGRALDSGKNHIISSIKAIEAPIRDAKAVVDDAKAKADAEHKERLQAKMDVLRNRPMQLINSSSVEIGEALEKVEAFEHADFYWFQDEAAKLKSDTRSKLGEMLSGAITREQKEEEQRIRQVELDRQQEAIDKAREEQEEKDRLANIEQEKEDQQRADERAELDRLRAEDDARKQAVIDADNALLKAKQAETREKERQEQEAKRIEQAKADAIEQEKKRQAAEQAAADAEAVKREANKKHKASINNAALKCLTDGGVDKDAAKLAVELIAKRLVTNVTITY